MKDYNKKSTKGFFSLLLISLVAITACTNEDDGIFLPDNQLQLKFGVNQPEARAIFTESTLPNGNPVGVKLDDGDETAYDKYTNITFTGSDDDKGQQVWSPSEAVVLGPTKATLYAYYPWTSGVSIDAIPVDMTAEDQTDWLYATPVENVNEDNPSHAVTMNHALANINLTINRGSYVGDGNISSITVQSDAFATKGTFNAAQPEPAFTSFADTEGQSLTRSVTGTLGSTTDIMVVPTATEDNIDFVINVDGVNYTAQAKPVQLVNGKSYLYTLTLNSTFLDVTEFSVQPWKSMIKENLTVELLSLVTLIYDVTSTSTPTQLFGANFNINQIDKMYIDGESVLPTATHTFTTTGQHLIKCTFKKGVLTSCEKMFQNCTNLIMVDACGWDTSNVTNMKLMFGGCTGLTTLDLSDLDIGEVTSLYGLFNGCANLTTLDVSSWDTSNVTTMYGLFYGCFTLTDVDVSKWNTGKVADMRLVFYNCLNLTYVNVSGWDTSNVTTMQAMFAGSSSGAMKIDNIDVSNWNTGKVTNMHGMFQNCINLTALDVSDWNTSNVTSMKSMFCFCNNLSVLDVGRWNTENVTDMYQMFNDCNKLTTLEVSNWNTGKVTNMRMMFGANYGKEMALTQLDVSRWDTGNVTNMEGMFARCKNLTSLDISGWDTGNVTTMYCMFLNCSNLTVLNLEGCNTEKVTNMNSMFEDCIKLEELTMKGTPPVNCTYVDMFSNINTNGIFKYNANVDYSKIIAELPATWTSEGL